MYLPEPLNIRVFEFRVFVFYLRWLEQPSRIRSFRIKSEIYRLDIVVTCYFNNRLWQRVLLFTVVSTAGEMDVAQVRGEIFYGSCGYRCVNNPIFVCCQNSKPSLVSCGYRQTSSLASLFDRLITVPPENLGWVFVNLAIGNPIRVYRIPRFKLLSESDILWLCHRIILYGFNNTYGTSAFIERNV